MSEHGSPQQDMSGLVSVSAGATLYVFLCIFSRERRRSGRGRRCRKQPPVSETPPPPLPPSLSVGLVLRVASRRCGPIDVPSTTQRCNNSVLFFFLMQKLLTQGILLCHLCKSSVHVVTLSLSSPSYDINTCFGISLSIF